MQPSFSSVTLASTTQLEFVASALPTADFNCEVVYARATSDSCIIVSDTQLTADFTKGVATSEQAVSPILRLISTDASVVVTHNAQAEESVTLANPIAIGTVSQGLTSSFAGGRSFTVDAPGLTQSIIQGDSEVRICQKECTIDLE